MIRTTFEVAMHMEYGNLGLRMKGRPHFDPLAGLACAHDMLEHPVRDDGTLEHELMALGASLFVRDGESYYHQRGQRETRPSQNIAADMVDQYHRHGEEYVLRRPPPTRRLRDWVQDTLDDTFNSARRLVRSECEAEPTWLHEMQRDKFVGWMRHGYNVVRRRFRGIRSHDMCYLFSAIESAADNWLAHNEYEGSLVRIDVDLRRFRVDTVDVTPEW